MGKHKQSLQTHHIYLGIGGMVAVAALVVALTFGLSSAQFAPPPDGGTFTPPPTDGTFHPPTDGTVTQPPIGTQSTGTQPGGTMRACGHGEQPTATNPCQPAGSTTGQPSTQPTGTQPSDSTMRECGPNEFPTAQNPCRMSAGQTGTGQQGQMPGQMTGDMRECGPNEFPTPQNPCRMSAGQTGTGQQSQMPGQMPGQTGDFFTPGSTPPGMQSCPDPFNPSGTSFFPTRTFDHKTNKMREATCDDFSQQAQMGGQGGPGFGPQPFFGGTQGGMQGGFPGFFGGQQGGMTRGAPGETSTNPCEFNPNDPFCRAGFDFGKTQQQFMFDETQFDSTQFQVKNVKGELRGLKQEAKGWARDIKQVNQQLKEIARESSGFACPTAVEVSTIVQQLQQNVNTVNALTESSTIEEIQKALALRDFVNGKWEDGEQVTTGLRQELFGGPPDEETGEPAMGKMQGLGVCRQISGMIRGSCEAAKHITRELNEMKEAGVSDEVAAKFEEAATALNQRCSNPFGVLQEKGISLEELTKPWMPPESCQGFGFFPGPGFGGPGMGGPGFGGPGGPGGGPGFGPPPFGGEGGPGFGPPPGFDFESLPPEFQQKFQQKFQQFQQSQGSPFGASVLSAQGRPFEDDEGFGGPQDFGGPPPAECMPPIERALGVSDIMEDLMNMRFEVERHFENANACKMFEFGQKKFSKEVERGTISLSEGGKARMQTILFDEGPAACDAGDTETVDELREEMFGLFSGGRGGFREGRRGSLGDVIDIDQLVEEKLREKLGQALGDDDSRVAALEKKLTELQSKLDESTKTILALSEKLSSMTAQLTATVDKLSEGAEKAISSISKFPDKELQNTVATSISQIAEKADELKDALPPEADKLLDATINSLVQSPPSSEVLSTIKDSLNALESYAGSGATKKEIIEKAREELSTVVAANASDVTNKVKEGICAAVDTCDHSQWFAAPALIAKSEGFIAAELKEIKPGEPETEAAAVTRVARIFEKAGGEKINTSEKDAVPGVANAPEWSRPFYHYLQDQGVSFGNFTDPNAPIDRADVALLIHEVLGDKLPDPSAGQLQEFLTPDVKGLSAEMQQAIAEVRFNGIMDTTDGTNFSPTVDFNRAQNALVTTKTFEAVQASANE